MIPAAVSRDVIHKLHVAKRTKVPSCKFGLRGAKIAEQTSANNLVGAWTHSKKIQGVQVPNQWHHSKLDIPNWKRPEKKQSTAQ